MIAAKAVNDTGIMQYILEYANGIHAQVGLQAYSKLTAKACEDQAGYGYGPSKGIIHCMKRTFEPLRKHKTKHHNLWLWPRPS